MYLKQQPLNYRDLTQSSTGTSTQIPDTRVVECPIGNFIVKVALSPTNEFLGVVEIAARNDFRKQSQRLQAPAFHDVQEFYKE